ncbi:unnamed protein product [Cylindrotheca closterium]|uniref:Protein kinase domain-containing protein n=1 Tax=Cylindrotheca closterium TaxID=2856 RepID=A0AAD2FRM1_9STRA|nr:unnamed protein product [Cylindrotheca closterium]
MSTSLDRTKTSRSFPSSSLEFSASLEFSEALHSLQESAPEVAKCLYEQNLSKCRFVAEENVAEIPRFLNTEIAEGLILGKGGFGTVYSAKGFSMVIEEGKEGLDDSVHDGEIESRNFIARHCHRSNGDARYAIKRLAKTTVEDVHKFLHGMTDLANETLFLSSIQHPHIIKLRGISMEEMFSENYFLILDRLYDTLAARLLKWKNKQRKHRGLVRILRRQDKSKRKKLLATRLTFASDLASALAYLHSHRIIHRDVKPTNIGFDVRGDIKIFDFGLAKEIPLDLKGSDTAFKLTAMAGTPRYMSPEVALGQKYNETCDIYSFGLLLWEIITLRLPYSSQKSIEDFRENVWSTNGTIVRPEVPKKLSSNLKQLLHRTWDRDLTNRPSARNFENALRFEASMLRDGALNDVEESLVPQRRRSTFLFIPGKGEAVNRSSPTIMALSEIAESDTDIFHAVGASHNSVFTLSDESENTSTPSMKVFNTSIRSESAVMSSSPLKHAQSDGAIPKRIDHAVGASHNNVFTLSERSDGTPKTNMFDTSVRSDGTPKTNMFDASIRSESAGLLSPHLKESKDGNIILNGFAVTRDCQISLSVGLEDPGYSPPALKSLSRAESGQSMASIDSLDF